MGGSERTGRGSYRGVFLHFHIMAEGDGDEGNAIDKEKHWGIYWCSVLCHLRGEALCVEISITLFVSPL